MASDGVVERYLGLLLNSKFASIDQSLYYPEASKELALILRRAYSDCPKVLQSLIFQDTLSAFRLLQVFPVQTQSAMMAANALLQSAECSLPKKKKILAIAEYKRAVVACKRRSKAEQEKQDLDLAQLPEDVLVLVFSFLDLHSLASAAIVSRSWHAAAYEDHLWESLFINFFRDSEQYSSFIRDRSGMTNGSQSDSVNRNTFNWREAFKIMYAGLSSGKNVHYRGYCRSCDLIVWLKDAKCYRQHNGRSSSHCKINPVSLDRIIEYVLGGSLLSESSSDSDSDTSSVFKLWDITWV